MQVNTRDLSAFFDAARQRQTSLVLATVVETQGSTYSKAGALMLIDEQGIFQGMLSGGCLEGDLAIRAQNVLQSGEPQLVSYDLGADNDELWGLGVGCDGLMRVLLQPLADSQAFEAFATLLAALDGDVAAVVSTVVESSLPSAPVGATTVLMNGESSVFGIDDASASEIAAGAVKLVVGGDETEQQISAGDAAARVMHSLIQPALKLLVLGGGLDAEPLVRYAADLGWKCTLVDHRPAYIEKGNFANAEQVICCSVDELPANVELQNFDAAVVMSHHLASDRGYLAHLAETGIAYVGLLGPVGRRERLLSELGATGGKLSGRMHGPAGLDIGGRGPAAIAMSIVAQMQQLLARD